MRPIGAAVEFDGSHEFFAGQIDIDYRPTRPRRHVEVYLKGAPIPVAELCAKSDQCAYEQEVRLVRTLPDCRPTGACPAELPDLRSADPGGRHQVCNPGRAYARGRTAGNLRAADGDRYLCRWPPSTTPASPSAPAGSCRSFWAARFRGTRSPRCAPKASSPPGRTALRPARLRLCHHAGVPLPLRVRILARPAGHRDARGRWTARPVGRDVSRCRRFGVGAETRV